MAGNAQWQATGTGVSCQGPCWAYVWQANGLYDHKCLHQDETVPCTAILRFPNGDRVRYTFACDANPATAGGIKNDGTYVWVTNFTNEEWL